MITNFLKNFLFFFVLLVGCAGPKAQMQVKKMTELQVLDHLTGSWELIGSGWETRDLMKGKSLDLHHPDPYFKQKFTFGVDSVFIEEFNDAVFYGKWHYEHAKHTIVLNDRDGIQPFHIVKITGRELKIETIALEERYMTQWRKFKE